MSEKLWNKWMKEIERFNAQNLDSKERREVYEKNNLQND